MAFAVPSLVSTKMAMRIGVVARLLFKTDRSRPPSLTSKSAVVRSRIGAPARSVTRTNTRRRWPTRGSRFCAGAGAITRRAPDTRQNARRQARRRNRGSDLDFMHHRSAVMTRKVSTRPTCAWGPVRKFCLSQALQRFRFCQHFLVARRPYRAAVSFSSKIRRSQSIAMLAQRLRYSPNMARPLRVHLPGALYHVMSRGNAKQQIFFDVEDRQTFLARLADSLARFRVDCLAYCEMDTHFHLLLTPHQIPLSSMMQQLNSTYSQFFKRLHRRVGHCLKGRFKALMVDRDIYFRQVLRYIVMNPVKAQRVQHPAEWEWSSYRSTAGLRTPAGFLTLTEVWKAFDPTDLAKAQEMYARFVVAAGDDAWPPDPFFLGTDAFRAQVTQELEPYRSNQEMAYMERFAVRPPLAALFASSDDRLTCNVSMREAFHRHGYTLREISEFLHVHPTTVWRRIHSMPQAATEKGVCVESPDLTLSPSGRAQNQDLTP